MHPIRHPVQWTKLHHEIQYPVVIGCWNGEEMGEEVDREGDLPYVGGEEGGEGEGDILFPWD